MVLDEIHETRALITLPHSPKGWQDFIHQSLRYHIRPKAHGTQFERFNPREFNRKISQH
jgi:hypothetical protein